MSNGHNRCIHKLTVSQACKRICALSSASISATEPHRGLCPEVCSVNKENPHESQHLTRLPDLPCASSWMSKHAQVGQTKAHAPQPIHLNDCLIHSSLSKNLSSLLLISLWLNFTGSSARNFCLSAFGSFSKTSGTNAIIAEPFSVIISAR